MNGRRMVPKSSAVGVVFSDASASGFGGYSVQCGSNLVAGSWSEGESKHSSTMREILAVKYVLLSLIERLSGLTIKWFSDNQNVPRIIEHGSSKEHLQTEAMSIFHMCCAHGISLEMEWIPRSDNEKADFLSRLQDTDDWGLSLSTFTSIDSVWGPHTIDRFANFRNTKLARFNSRYWNPGSEAIDTFIIDWSGENNYLCPPISLIPRVLLHMKNCHACGTLVVPLWPSSPFWPMICSDGWHLNDFIIAWMDLPTSKEAFTAGSCGSLFGNEDLHFRMLALRVRFWIQVQSFLFLFCFLLFTVDPRLSVRLTDYLIMYFTKICFVADCAFCCCFLWALACPCCLQQARDKQQLFVCSGYTGG